MTCITLFASSMPSASAVCGKDSLRKGLLSSLGVCPDGLMRHLNDLVHFQTAKHHELTSMQTAGRKNSNHSLWLVCLYPVKGYYQRHGRARCTGHASPLVLRLHSQFFPLCRLFEPYIVKIIPDLLERFGDSSAAVREATEAASRAIMSRVSGQGRFPPKDQAPKEDAQKSGSACTTKGNVQIVLKHVS